MSLSGLSLNAVTAVVSGTPVTPDVPAKLASITLPVHGGQLWS